MTYCSIYTMTITDIRPMNRLKAAEEPEMEPGDDGPGNNGPYR